MLKKRVEIQRLMGDTDEIVEKVGELCGELFDSYKSNKSPEKIQAEMKQIITNHGFEFLGRGQNRIGFRYPNSEFMYKFPYREIGLQDNAAERYISSVITSDAEAYKELSNHFALVTDFVLDDGYENLCICMEFVPNLEIDGSSIGTPEDKSIKAIVTYGEEFVETLKKINGYFHIVDAHPTSAAMNWGTKENGFCIRDYGYFVPRMGDLESLTAVIGKKEVQYVYDTKEDIILDKSLSVNEKIDKLADTTESWVPVDENGNRVGNDADEIEVTHASRALLAAFRNEYL